MTQDELSLLCQSLTHLASTYRKDQLTKDSQSGYVSAKGNSHDGATEWDRLVTWRTKGLFYCLKLTILPYLQRNLYAGESEAVQINRKNKVIATERPWPVTSVHRDVICGGHQRLKANSPRA